MSQARFRLMFPCVMSVITSSLLATMLVAGCKASSFSGSSTGSKSSPSKTDDSAPNKSDEKPTDVGEGVPGYLVDPDWVPVSRKGDHIWVRGPAGTIAAIEGKTSDVIVSVIEFDAKTAATLDEHAKAGDDLESDGRLIGAGHARPDGSVAFNSEYVSRAGTHLVVTAAPVRISGTTVRIVFVGGKRQHFERETAKVPTTKPINRISVGTMVEHCISTQKRIDALMKDGVPVNDDLDQTRAAIRELKTLCSEINSTSSDAGTTVFSQFRGNCEQIRDKSMPGNVDVHNEINTVCHHIDGLFQDSTAFSAEVCAELGGSWADGDEANDVRPTCTCGSARLDAGGAGILSVYSSECLAGFKDQ